MDTWAANHMVCDLSLQNASTLVKLMHSNKVFSVKHDSCASTVKDCYVCPCAK